METSFNLLDEIGKIVANLQTLEFTLRLALNELDSSSKNQNSFSFNFDALNVGELVPENYLTNYDSLKKLIKDANSEFKLRGMSEQVDISIVELRDAIAHGRVLSKNPNGPFHLLKFSNPTNGEVKVTVSIKLTQEWVNQQINRLHQEILKVIRISQTLSLKCFPTE